eukprot:CAMPEP_0114338264 /NCGR_PEP_ID=MMETSP0101-20121206/6918_1 /TAXON_ID=38822 ORGANISM="Pteridomonas danica, Strain PT" /NCGR_SAMPLE_ID=MMETSP0101 /ASSEMBLY_ACC=CAM_ASM_000211 /LENGTH=227 /DNA_ID=CAMNT_0001470783 /DNA_START=590 /DNA_END=1273 /DNA_ORIENTATION=+
MFIVPGLPEDFAYTPRARKEISEVRFFDLENPLPNEKFNFNKYKTKLKQWIKKYQKQQRSLTNGVAIEASNQLNDNVASLFATEQVSDRLNDSVASLFATANGASSSSSVMNNSVASLFAVPSQTQSSSQPNQKQLSQSVASIFESNNNDHMTNNNHQKIQVLKKESMHIETQSKSMHYETQSNLLFDICPTASTSTSSLNGLAPLNGNNHLKTIGMFSFDVNDVFA